MGRSGEALRAAKLQSAKYTFTGEQLRAHDEAVLEAYRARILRKHEAVMEEKYAAKSAELKEMVAREWEAREKLFNSDDAGDKLFLILSLLLATSSRVLIERFGWKPIPKDGAYDRRSRMMRYCDFLVDEINSICGDTDKDIRAYCDEVYDLYGIRFVQGDAEVTDG